MEFLLPAQRRRNGGFLLANDVTISPREAAVLEQVWLGLSNKEMAAHFSISEAAVEQTLSRLFMKLDLPRARAIVLWGFLRSVEPKA